MHPNHHCWIGTIAAKTVLKYMKLLSKEHGAHRQTDVLRKDEIEVHDTNIHSPTHPQKAGEKVVHHLRSSSSRQRNRRLQKMHEKSQAKKG